MGILREYAGKTPVLGQRVYLAETAAVIGDVVLGDDVSVWYNSVVRGDCNFIRIGVTHISIARLRGAISDKEGFGALCECSQCWIAPA